MSKLEELIRELCPNGVEFKFLGDVSINKDSLRKPITSDKRVAGDYPYYGASGIVDYINEYIFDGDYLLVSEDGANLLSRNTPIAFSISGKNWVNNHAHVLEFNTEAERKFIEYYLNSINLEPYISGSAQPKLNQKNLNIIRVPAPPLEVQQEIVQLLDEFTTKTTELQDELNKEYEARKKQYEFYRDELLTKKNGLVSNQVLLSDIAKIKNGKDYKHLNSGTYPVYGSGGIMTTVSEFVYDKPSVLIPRKGSLGNLYYVEEPFWNVDTIFYTEVNEDMVLPKYLFYLLQNEHLEKLNNAGGVPSLTQSVLNKVKLYIPSLDEQHRIVCTLDYFKSICSKLQSNISTELESRQKQYEFYRDKLLTFKELNESEVN